MGHALGYARVSTTAQDPSLQTDALTASGCAQVWTDVASVGRNVRPELARLLERLLPGDTPVVWRLVAPRPVPAAPARHDHRARGQGSGFPVLDRVP